MLYLGLLAFFALL